VHESFKANDSILFDRHVLDEVVEDSSLCFVCDKADPTPDVYCAVCASVYHDTCFDEDPLHDDEENPHQQFSIKRRNDQIYINQPNHRETITDSEIYRDRKNTFIELDHRTLKLKFADNAFHLLRPSTTDISFRPSEAGSSHEPESPGPIATPGFISFIGKTGTGKSWIIRGLMKDFPRFPAPLPSPGRTANHIDSTSSNINLYVDAHTIYTSNPILFMDVEGLDGSDVPLTLKEAACPPPAARRTIAQKVYPRLAYAFSNCVMFVTSDSMKAGKRIVDAITKFANTTSSGSRHQGFRPALFIVFNKVVDQESDWSIKASTTAFNAAFKD
jgi:hypothetical protein